MQLLKLLSLSMFYAFAGGVTVTTAAGLNLDCQEFDRLLDITERASKFERVDGDHRIDSELMDLNKYGVNIFIPKPKYKNVLQLRSPSTGVRFLPENSSLDSPEDVGVTVLFSNITYNSRNHLRRMVSDTDFAIYRDIRVFDFLVMSLGKDRHRFQCKNQENAVAMFVASNVSPLGNSHTYVYNLPEINALLLVPKDDNVGVLKLIYSKNLNDLIYVFIGGDPEARKEIIESISKIEEKRGQSTNSKAMVVMEEELN